MGKTVTDPGVRPPAMAGRFYPSDPSELRASVAGYLSRTGPNRGASDDRTPAPPSGDTDSPTTGLPKAIIAPHAGYVFSGPVAGSVYRHLREIKDTIQRVVLIGPAHYLPFHGVVTSSCFSFATPLGKIALDTDAIRLATEQASVWIYNEAHQPEHSLEVHLPFLQEVLGEFKLVPLLVGEASPPQVARVLEVLWGGVETLIVVSSDLSHYHDYDTAREMDAAASRAIEALRPGDLDKGQACGLIPIQALLERAGAHDLSARTLDLRNSADTAGGPGSRDRVVGYGSYIFA